MPKTIRCSRCLKPLKQSRKVEAKTHSIYNLINVEHDCYPQELETVIPDPDAIKNFAEKIKKAKPKQKSIKDVLDSFPKPTSRMKDRRDISDESSKPFVQNLNEADKAEVERKQNISARQPVISKPTMTSSAPDAIKNVISKPKP